MNSWYFQEQDQFPFQAKRKTDSLSWWNSYLISKHYNEHDNALVTFLHKTLDTVLTPAGNNILCFKSLDLFQANVSWYNCSSSAEYESYTIKLQLSRPNRQIVRFESKSSTRNGLQVLSLSVGIRIVVDMIELWCQIKIYLLRIPHEMCSQN